MKPLFLAALALTVACTSGTPKDYQDLCSSDADCSESLSCETVVDIYYSMYDTADPLTWEACTMACETDSDCPVNTIGCGDSTDVCLKGICNPPNCV